MADLQRSRNLGDYDAIFTTYSQLQTVQGKETQRHEFLRAFAPNALLILDESHEAGGSISVDDDGRANNTSARALFVRELVELADGVFCSSATYAKRPDVMDLHAKTDMRLAVRNLSSLTWMVQKGGIPMQQALATMLTDAGQYLRRERYNTEAYSFFRKALGIDWHWILLISSEFMFTLSDLYEEHLDFLDLETECAVIDLAH
ncbi:hypothetical protein NIES593_08290 [Hydrococcus rivularis NIES-593]|uniref:Helicase ATP-binding domain-containing protein n=1 Tax=Hydrococcus rivularis NIES-593 TaxID=1921803 RepID=A0A1U7HKN5_9CYAN|nr:hypothetical protein [Hydrococcus rivularis]OKH24146.1 hypothetical protein NIES593_08290 [Hydrococcus rivularis NIES-593]